MATETQAEQTKQAQSLAQQMRVSCLGVRVGRLHRLVTRSFDQALRPLGLTISQMEILSGLTLMRGPVRPAYIADKLGVERSTMSRNLALMQTKGLITNAETSPAGRSMTVTITPHGTATLADAHAAWNSAQTELIKQLGADAPSTLDTWMSETNNATPSDPPARSERRQAHQTS